MHPSPQLTALAQYLAGEFDNREQALDSPAWYVHLRLWQVPIAIFTEDSLTIFAEQANILKLDKPYRQRVMRLRETNNPEVPLQVQYYMPKEPEVLAGGGCNPSLLTHLTPEQLELLPGCVLNISIRELATNNYLFSATPPPQACCTFSYQGNTIQVSLGFEATQEELNTYDKGIDSTTGKATWGAILGPYRYTKRKQLEFYI
ncbi:MAG: chorismate mutase [Richelia sp. SM1_7_0]|nr:chorismate mutase [Richelia sp. SM1_7_0]NJR17299.1 chorismate mutase [Calothrix sp. CSU_2_0]